VARGSILKRPSGNYAIRYRDHNGRRYYETIGPNRKDADAALSQRMHELNQGSWRQPSSETLTAYTMRWLARRDPSQLPTGREGRIGRGRLAPSTHREYQRSLELHVLPRLGHRPLATLQPTDIDQLILQLENTGAAAGTIRNTIAPLRKLLGDAVHQGLLPSNPAARPDLPPAQEFIGQELPAEHTTKIADALTTLAPPDPLSPGQPDLFYLHLYTVALGTGLRQGELRALQWQHIDKPRRLIRIEQAYSRDQLKRPKSEAGIRSIPLFKSVETALAVLAARAIERGIYAPAELIFQTERGTPLHPSNYNRRIWQPALRHAHLVNEHGKTIYRFHDLRHTTISRLVAAGADIKLIQQIAGHSNPLITLKRYSHLLDHRLTDAATRFDPAEKNLDPR
jgi:integrase